MKICQTCGNEYENRNYRHCGEECQRIARKKTYAKYNDHSRRGVVGGVDAPLIWDELVLQLAHKAIIDCPGPELEDCATCKVANLCPRVARLEVAVS